MSRSDRFLVGMAIFAAVAWLLDPQRGRRRNAGVPGRAAPTGGGLDGMPRGRARHAGTHASGLGHDSRGELVEQPVEDHVLEERVRSALDRVPGNPGTLIVSADSGVVVLSGDAPASEVQELERTARAVRGVEHVENLLRGLQDPTGAPGLQGAGHG